MSSILVSIAVVLLFVAIVATIRNAVDARRSWNETIAMSRRFYYREFVRNALLLDLTDGELAQAVLMRGVKRRYASYKSSGSGLGYDPGELRIVSYIAGQTPPSSSEGAE